MMEILKRTRILVMVTTSIKDRTNRPRCPHGVREVDARWDRMGIMGIMGHN